MAPAGEVVFTRDHKGRIWEHRRLGGFRPTTVSEATVDRAVIDHGYDRIDEDVETWADVTRFVEERTRKGDGVDLPVNPTVARALLPRLNEWLSSPADRERVVSVVARLLREPSVADDPELRRALTELLAKALPPDPEPPFDPSTDDGPPAGERSAVALRYFDGDFALAA
jgi:hypothetical protein